MLCKENSIKDTSFRPTVKRTFSGQVGPLLCPKGRRCADVGLGETITWDEHLSPGSVRCYCPNGRRCVDVELGEVITWDEHLLPGSVRCLKMLAEPDAGAARCCCGADPDFGMAFGVFFYF